MPQPFISIVTPTYNRVDLLLQHLDALAAQSAPFDSFEVIVVDDGSEDGTRETLAAYRAPYPLIVHRQENRGLAASRNAGIRRASGTVVLLLDDDVIPQPDLVAEHCAPHRSRNDIVVLGSLPYPPHLPRDSFLWYLERIGHFDLYSRKDKYEMGRPPLQPLNGNSSVGRRHLLDAGLYDETFRDYGGEDVELGYRLEKTGLQWIYNPKAVGYHHHTKGFADYVEDQRRSGMAIARVFRKHPEIKVARKIEIVTDPLTTIRPRRLPMALAARSARWAPVTVSAARALAVLLGRSYALRRLAYRFYQYVGYAAYAEGIRRELASSR